MKKLFLIVGLLYPTILSAQSKFEPQIKAAYELGIDADANKSLGGEFVAGYRVIDALRLGVGIGGYWCEHLYSNAYYNKTINYYEKEYRETASYFPVFFDAKYNFITTGKWRPFVSADLGYSIFNSASDYAKDNNLGVFVKPTVGIDCNLGKCDLTFEIGYRYQDREFSNVKMGYSQMVFLIGCQF